MRVGEMPSEKPALPSQTVTAQLTHWLREDFEIGPEAKTDVDPWDPLSTFPSPPSSDGELYRAGAIGSEDFWEPAPASHADLEIAGVLSWQADIRLPDFIPHAAENPFYLELRAPSSSDKAVQRARWLVSLLDLPQLERRRLFEHRFSELFFQHPHAATFSALADLALEDADADDIWSAFELRQIWASSPLWWSMRRRGSRQPLIPYGGINMLGWARSYRFVANRKGLPPEAIIESDWFDDWLETSIGDPLYWRFIDYAEARIEAFAAGVLASPVPPRRHISSRPMVTMDGFNLFNSFSRTGLLCRGQTEAVALTNTSSEDVLTPKKVRA
ncbi:hypothetical protein OZ411_22375 [Bradyrhizobium sp. Arg237L]|uniref:hypothetical protein n=1 Tax=Bradyrhizobium sp. Arg237L TaxID=3003352 RepID=UPI00249EAA5D|nr:hypothetical protein [Bradyrhizobium sp. Arg237L]MDI4235557.1 hypothetical protein [Bradyrhizobium sp. Arg237L]